MKTKEKGIKILLIGPVTNIKANLIGGATISFGCLADYLTKKGERFEVINTQRWSKGYKRFFSPFYILIMVALKAPFADVLFLNSSRVGTKFLAPIVFTVSRVFNKKFVFRPFGGNIKDYTARFHPFLQWLATKTVWRSDIFFLQTKTLMRYYADKGSNLIQLPTSREAPSQQLLRGKRAYQKRFIYLGYVNQSKGVDHIIEAAELLDDSYTFHIYGPLIDEKYIQLFGQPNKLYKGILKRSEVLKTIQSYDVLILPTYYKGEGYPGSIIEAYSLGLPVITTQWRSIPEIVKDKETGLLITPISTVALINAIEHFNTSNYTAYSERAQQYFMDSFNTDTVLARAFEAIKKLFP